MKWSQVILIAKPSVNIWHTNTSCNHDHEDGIP